MLTQLSLFCCWLLPNVELKHFPCPAYWHQHPLSQSIHGTCQRCHTAWLSPDQTGCNQAVDMVLDCTDYEEGLVVLGTVCSSYQSPASLTMKQQSCVNRGYARLNYQPLFGKWAHVLSLKKMPRRMVCYCQFPPFRSFSALTGGQHKLCFIEQISNGGSECAVWCSCLGRVLWISRDRDGRRIFWVCNFWFRDFFG